MGGLWAALHYPWLFLALLVVFVALAIWLLPKIWRGLRRGAARIRGWLGGAEPAGVEEVGGVR